MKKKVSEIKLDLVLVAKTFLKTVNSRDYSRYLLLGRYRGHERFYEVRDCCEIWLIESPGDDGYSLDDLLADSVHYYLNSGWRYMN